MERRVVASSNKLFNQLVCLSAQFTFFLTDLLAFLFVDLKPHFLNTLTLVPQINGVFHIKLILLISQIKKT